MIVQKQFHFLGLFVFWDLDVIHKLYILYKTRSSFVMSYELCLHDMRLKMSWSLKETLFYTFLW